MSCCGSSSPPMTVLADDETRAKRLATCGECDTRQVHFGIATCGTPIVGGLFDADACGCILIAKASFAGQHCPQGKW